MTLAQSKKNKHAKRQRQAKRREVDYEKLRKEYRRRQEQSGLSPDMYLLRELLGS